MKTISTILNDNNPISEEFSFSGNCHICAVGSGSIEIQRKLGGEFVTLTDLLGDQMAFTGTDVLFNSTITSTLRIPHRIVSASVDDIDLTIIAEKA